jgi:hypothetical protein
MTGVAAAAGGSTNLCVCCRTANATCVYAAGPQTQTDPAVPNLGVALAALVARLEVVGDTAVAVAARTAAVAAAGRAPEGRQQGP